jgi:HPt (histidine-containing phosphotransfer) domain-containing protein
LAALRRGGEDRDAGMLRNASHTLKSASATIGALSLSACCAKLESFIRDGNVDEAMSLVKDIMMEFEMIRPSIEAHARGAAECLAG